MTSHNPPLKIGVIIDDLRLARWQADALRSLPANSQFLLYNCINSRRSRRSLRHSLYYLLNLASLRTRVTASVPLPKTLGSVRTFNFAAEFDGSWQRLPTAVIERLVEDRPAVLIKFGMGLLRVPAVSVLPIPILSYHHGDPRSFRGRPAGFYELLTGAKAVGQVVQVLSNELDAGEIVAFGETRCHPHSYRKTMLEAYRRSPLLLKPAIHHVLSGHRLPLKPTGQIRRLPSNSRVLGFLAKQLASLFRHWFYGAFFQKQWKVAEADARLSCEVPPFSSMPDKDGWDVVKCPTPYRFLADPFFHPEGGILVEALSKSRQRGEILHLAGTNAKKIATAENGHFSYPGTLTLDRHHYLIPEISEWSPPKVYRLAEMALDEVGHLDVVGKPRLLDPTIFDASGTLFLFANDEREGASVLRLWLSNSLFGTFKEHPLSPIRISPLGSRMAGSIYTAPDGGLFRFGQDLSGHYGDGIIVFRIDRLSPIDYQETEVSEIRLPDQHGPHTLNFRGSRIVFDFYSNTFTPMAGIRRLRARFARRLS